MFIPDEFFRNNEYLDFISSSEGKLYYFLRSNIVRKSDLFAVPYYHPAYIIYKNYFLNGFLVARYPQKQLAELLHTTENKIRERLNDLEKKGFIKKIKTRYKKNLICYYVLGTWSCQNEEKEYREDYFLDKIFEQRLCDDNDRAISQEEDFETNTTPKWCGDNPNITTPKWCGIEPT